MQDDRHDAVEKCSQTEDILCCHVGDTGDTVVCTNQSKNPNNNEERKQNGGNCDIVCEVELQLVLH